MRGPTLVVFVIVTALASAVHSETQSAPSFEVASIRVNTSGAQGRAYEVRPDGVAVTNHELRWLIARVYDVPFSTWQHRLKGGSEEVMTARFDIQATGSQRMSQDDVAAAMRELLAERFHLQIRKELMATPVYALTVLRKDRFGPELRPTTIDCAVLSATIRAERGVPLGVPIGVPSPRDAKNRPVCWPDQPGAETLPSGVRRRRGAGPFSELVRTIDNGAVDRPIIDATGLSGLFEWQFDFAPGTAIPADAPVPSLFRALEEQLGLRLEPRSAPLEVHVIDRVEMPPPN